MTASLGSVPGTLIDWAAGVIGISPAIVRAQINEESGGNPGAVSPTGAQGVAQFEPGTWTGEGCSGSPFNVNDAMRCYAKYMYSLVKQFHGNVRDALAAYNAGPGNLQAGYGYADAILAAAGQPQTATASGGTGAAGSGGGSGSSSSGQADAACAFSIGGQHLGLVFGHGPSLPSACLIRKTEVRALMGGVVIWAGGVIFLGGVVLLAAFAFRASGAARAVAGVASVVPGTGGVARAARTVAPAAAAAPEAAPPPARRAEPAREPAGGRKIRTGRGQVSEDFAARYGTA